MLNPPEDLLVEVNSLPIRWNGEEIVLDDHFYDEEEVDDDDFV